MRSATEHGVSIHGFCADGDGYDLRRLQQRVSAEFREMPGLIVTVAQAARLFAVDAARCGSVLDALVARGVLATDGRAFARADGGRRCA